MDFNRGRVFLAKNSSFLFMAWILSSMRSFPLPPRKTSRSCKYWLSQSRRIVKEWPPIWLREGYVTILKNADMLFLLSVKTFWNIHGTRDFCNHLCCCASTFMDNLQLFRILVFGSLVIHFILSTVSVFAEIMTGFINIAVIHLGKCQNGFNTFSACKILYLILHVKK